MRPPPETRLCDHESAARRAQHVVGRNAHVFVADVGMTPMLFGLETDTDVADDADPGRVRRHDQHRHALVGADVGIGHAHHDQERGMTRVRREPFLPVDDPLVAVADGPRREERRIGARMGLRH